MTASLDQLLCQISPKPLKELTFLSGAGISADSGIPTFRGPEGYWTIGSREYRPEEMATYEMFKRRPWDVWNWYLYRRYRCRSVAPNPAHNRIAAFQQNFPNCCTLITQNVDGLHRRAGSPEDSSFEIHGNIDLMRCVTKCSELVTPVPIAPTLRSPAAPLSAAQKHSLICPDCQNPMRPHVLWFDEYYDETLYRADSAWLKSVQAQLLIVIGTSAATSFPLQLAQVVSQKAIALIDINPEPNPFGELASRISNGLWLPQKASLAVPEVIDALVRNQH